MKNYYPCLVLMGGAVASLLVFYALWPPVPLLRDGDIQLFLALAWGTAWGLGAFLLFDFLARRLRRG